jgi:hypothetical protein
MSIIIFDGEFMTSHIEELGGRLSDLKKLAAQLTADKRWLSTSLGTNDPLTVSAQGCRVPILSPLTIGTLLASVLGEIDSVECAIKGIDRTERPGEGP